MYTNFLLNDEWPAAHRLTFRVTLYIVYKLLMKLDQFLEEINVKLKERLVFHR